MNKKLLIVILNILNGLSIVPSAIMWMVVGYMYDSPYASYSLIQQVFTYLVLAIPAVVPISVFFAIKFYRSKDDNISFKISVLTFVYLVSITLGLMFTS